MSEDGEVSTTEPPQSAGTHERVVLRRELGLREAVAIGIGGTVGGGIFVLVGVAGATAGPAALVAFVLAFLASLAIALPYAELACRIPMAGGGYAFARQVLGPHWGFAMGWIYWGAYLFLSGYVTIGFGAYLASATGLPTPIGAGLLVLACTLVNLFGVRVSGRTQTVVVVVAVAGLALFSFWGLPGIDLAKLEPFAPAGVRGVLLATLVAFLSFGGFDIIAASGEEVKRPERNLPRAILLTLGIVLVLYLLVAFVALSTVPSAELGRSASPLAEAAALIAGEPGRHVVVFCALLTTAATANAILVATSRTVFAMSRDRLLPAPLGWVAASTGAPWTAVLANGLAMLSIALVGTVTLASRTGGFLYVLHFMVPLVAVVKLRMNGGPRPAFSMPVPQVLVPLAFLACTGLLVASGAMGSLVGSAWLVAGFALYGGHLVRASPALRRQRGD